MPSKWDDLKTQTLDKMKGRPMEAGRSPLMELDPFVLLSLINDAERAQTVGSARVQNFTVTGEAGDIQWAQDAIVAMQGCKEPQQFTKFVANMVEIIKAGDETPGDLWLLTKNFPLEWLKERWPSERRS